MARIGPKLQETRLKRGLTLERIADDTNISIRFLAKLENDDFTGFPGEPYLVGFIRNYAEYLGIDPNLAVDAYRGKSSFGGNDLEESMQTAQNPGGVPATTQDEGQQAEEGGKSLKPSTPEAPLQDKPRKGERRSRNSKKRDDLPFPPSAPNQTESGSPGDTPAPEGPRAAIEPQAAKTRVRKPGPTFRPGNLAAIGALALLGLAASWIISRGGLLPPGSGGAKRTPTEHRADGSPYQTRLYPGDSILVPLGEDVYKLSLANIGDVVELDTPFGRRSLSLGESSTLDADSDGFGDIDVSIGDFERRKPGSGALVIVSVKPAESAEAPPGEVTVPGGKPGSTSADAVAPNGVPASDSSKVILRSARGPYPFVVQASFRGNCLFRYEADRKEWVEKYYSKGETVTINVTNQLTIWTSNAQAAKLGFQASGGKSVDFELGAPGEIAVKRIAWEKSEGSWALVATTLD